MAHFVLPERQSGPTGRACVPKEEQLATIDQRMRKAIVDHVSSQEEEQEMIKKAKQQ